MAQMIAATVDSSVDGRLSDFSMTSTIVAFHLSITSGMKCRVNNTCTFLSAARRTEELETNDNNSDK